MSHVACLMAALSEPIRLKALRLLWDEKEHCVCELMEALNATQSRMSRHMAILKTAGLLTSRQDAQWVRYRRNPKLPRATGTIVEAVLSAFAKEEKKNV